MSNLEHYFENLLHYGADISGEPNKNALSKEQQEAVEECATYIIYTIFCGREDFLAHNTSIKELEQEDVLEKIRTEIDEQYDRVYLYDISCAGGLEMALEIIDKYMKESEE